MLQRSLMSFEGLCMLAANPSGHLGVLPAEFGVAHTQISPIEQLQRSGIREHHV